MEIPTTKAEAIALVRQWVEEEFADVTYTSRELAQRAATAYNLVLEMEHFVVCPTDQGKWVVVHDFIEGEVVTREASHG